ncbi:MAG: hypothetical protein IJT18_01120 [Oscillospiraceae bacterium]|nr:hypothetical protein [Oscillospiraceae bacterium]
MFAPVTEDLLHVTQYELLGKLPDPILRTDGSRLRSPEEWDEHRKTLYKTAIELQYGTMPPQPEFLEVEPLSPEGKPMRVYHVHTGTREKPVTLRLVTLLPPDAENVPVIVTGDDCWRYARNADYLDAALKKGIGWVLFDRTELAHDVRGEGRRQGALYQTYPDRTFGAIGAWAWGYSRAVDALEQLALPIDLGWITFCGHSRGAKTAALAGALDERARIVNPNSTCAGACGCYRIHMKGFCGADAEKRSETLDDLLRRFDFWMGEGMAAYRDDEAALPFDAHFLKAMVAPRTLYISEAAGDLWANPVGSYETTIAAREVYRFLGAEENLIWSFRPGYHEHTADDVAMLVNVIRCKRYGEKLNDRFFRTPFPPPEDAFDWAAPK